MVLKEKKIKSKGNDEKVDPENTPETNEQKNSNEGNKPEENEDLKGIKEQLEAEKDKVLRMSAEFENFRKRKQREIDDFKKFANETVFRQLLSVVDNLERAIDAAIENPDDSSSLLEGVKLTHKDILKLFESFSVKLVEAENQPFDPNFHQAVTHEENNDVPENTVTNVLQKGYLLHDRLIRPSMVVVSKKTEKQTDQTQED